MAPTGTDVDEVVWLPPTQTNFTVSPRFIEKEDGVNEKFATFTTLVTADELVKQAMTITAEISVILLTE